MVRENMNSNTDETHIKSTIRRTKERNETKSRQVPDPNSNVGNQKEALCVKKGHPYPSSPFSSPPLPSIPCPLLLPLPLSLLPLSPPSLSSLLSLPSPLSPLLWCDFFTPVQKRFKPKPKTHKSRRQGEAKTTNTDFRPQKTTIKPLLKVTRSISVHFGRFRDLYMRRHRAMTCSGMCGNQQDGDKQAQPRSRTSQSAAQARVSDHLSQVPVVDKLFKKTRGDGDRRNLSNLGLTDTQGRTCSVTTSVPLSAQQLGELKLHRQVVRQETNQIHFTLHTCEITKNSYF